MTAPTPDRDDPDTGRGDEDREISDVGLPRPGDPEPTAPDADDEALDEVFPPAEDSTR